MIDWNKSLRFKMYCPVYGDFVYLKVKEVSGVIQYRDEKCRIVTYIGSSRDDEEVTIVANDSGGEVVGIVRGYVYNLKESFSPILMDNVAKIILTSVGQFSTKLDAYETVDKNRYDILGYIERNTGEISWC